MVATRAISVRLDAELADVLTEEAARNSRSVTKQLEYLLRRALKAKIVARRADEGAVYYADDDDDEAAVRS